MAVANALAYFDMATTTTVKSFISQAKTLAYYGMATTTTVNSFIVQALGFQYHISLKLLTYIS
jgi:hypothetical protein